MRRGLLIALAAALLSAIGPATEAQTPRQLLRLQQMQHQPPRLRQPRVNPNLPPPILPPSAAARQALRANPGAKLLGVKRNANDYVITLRQQGAVRRVVIPGM
jgi:hypothetical protein